jgi:hypothetical protein
MESLRKEDTMCKGQQVEVRAFVRHLPALEAANGYEAWPERFQFGVEHTRGSITRDVYSQTCTTEQYDTYAERADSAAIMIVCALEQLGYDTTLVTISS